MVGSAGLDTDSLSHAHQGNPRIIERLRELDEIEFAISVVTKIEILRARHEFLLKASDARQLLLAQQWLNRSEELLSPLVVLPVDENAASEFERLQKNKKLKKIGRADLLIASIALANRAILVTRNVRHFSVVPQLRVENWVG